MVQVPLRLVVEASIDELLVLPGEHALRTLILPRSHVRVCVAKPFHVGLLLFIADRGDERRLRLGLLVALIRGDAGLSEPLVTLLVLAGAASSPKRRRLLHMLL